MPHVLQRILLDDKDAGLQQVRLGSNQTSSAPPLSHTLTSYGQMSPPTTMSLVAHLVTITEPLRIHIPAGWFSLGPTPVRMSRRSSIAFGQTPLTSQRPR
jgi:hypothetical protein